MVHGEETRTVLNQSSILQMTVSDSSLNNAEDKNIKMNEAVDYGELDVGVAFEGGHGQCLWQLEDLAMPCIGLFLQHYCCLHELYLVYL